MAGEGIAAAKMGVRRGRKVRMVVRIVNFMMEVEVDFGLSWGCGWVMTWNVRVEVEDELVSLRACLLECVDD
jgi:hypothetical protein